MKQKRDQIIYNRRIKKKKNNLKRNNITYKEKKVNNYAYVSCIRKVHNTQTHKKTCKTIKHTTEKK